LIIKSKESKSPNRTKEYETYEDDDINHRKNNKIIKSKDLRVFTNGSNNSSNKNLDKNFEGKKKSLKKLDLEMLLNHPIKEEKDLKARIPEYLFCLISEEDRIFDEYGQKYKELHKGLELFKSLTKKKKKGVVQMDPIQKLLSKVYKSDRNFLYDLKVAKKQKNLDLDNYQKNLISTISKILTKESITKLSKNMKDLKFNANSVDKFQSEDFLKEIEEKEFEIVLNLQKTEEQLKKLRAVGRIHQVQPIPTIKFKKITKD